MAEDRATRIHRLFNELQAELAKEADEATIRKDTADRVDDLYPIASAVDAAHHDYTELTLQEIC